MSEVKTRICVAEDHAITGVAPADVPAGEHDAVITVGASPRLRKPFRSSGFPIDHGPWDETISLRREDMYGDGGR
jgi:hypothetical protein